MKSWLAMMCLSFIVFGSQTIRADQYPEPEVNPSQPQNKQAFPDVDWKNSPHQKTNRNNNPKGFEPDLIKPKQFPEPQIKPNKSKNKKAFPRQDWKSQQKKKNGIPDHDWKGTRNNAAHPDFDWKPAPTQKNTRATKSNPNHYPEPQIKPKQQKNKAFPGEDWKPKSGQKAPDEFMPETF